MGRKRGSTDLSLVFALDKPCGMTSHDVVSRVRRATGEGRVGHCGTLDPAASGVMLMCAGPATRLDKYLVGHDKTYVAEVAFGAATDTDDAEGSVLETAPVPAELADRGTAERAVAGLVGEFDQMPPAYSALKVGGVKACDAARRGSSVELKARPVAIREAQLIDVFQVEGDVAPLRWVVALTVSSGTYVRSVARDLGASLGVPAHLSALRRTRLGSVGLDDVSAWPELPEKVAEPVDAAVPGTDAQSAPVPFPSKPLDPVELLGFPVIDLPDDQSQKPIQGCKLAAPASFGQDRPPLVSVTIPQGLAAVYRYEAGSYRPDCVFSKAVRRA